MDPKLLSPPASGTSLSESKPPSTPSIVVDGFKFDWAPKNPAGEPTRPKETSNPPPVELQEPRLDLTAKVSYEDQDRVFVQAEPYIFQRKQGGWNAKLPEVDLDDHRTIVASVQVSSENSRRQENSPSPNQRGETSMYMALKPTWTAQRTPNKRELGFMIADTNNPAYGAKVPSGGAHDKVQNHKAPDVSITNGVARSTGTQHSEGFKPNGLPVRDESLELDVPRRVLWQ